MLGELTLECLLFVMELLLDGLFEGLCDLFFSGGGGHENRP